MTQSAGLTTAHLPDHLLGDHRHYETHDTARSTDLQEMPGDSSASKDSQKDSQKDRPALRFLTRSHPDDFKDDEARQDVRSHVMRDYRRKNSPMSSRKPSKSRSRAPRESSSSASAPPRDQQPSAANTQAAAHGSVHGPIDTVLPASLVSGIVHIGCNHTDRARLSLRPATDNAGPFPIPSFLNAAEPLEPVCFPCLARLATSEGVRDFRSPHLPDDGGGLSPARITVIAALLAEIPRHDLIYNAKEQAQGFLDLKADVIRRLNENLADEALATQSETVYGILSLIMIEAMQGDDRLRGVHMNGFSVVVNRQGGLGNLVHRDELTFMGSESMLLISSLFEQDPPQIHRGDGLLHMIDLPWAAPALFPFPLIFGHEDSGPLGIQDDFYHLLRQMQAITMDFLVQEQQTTTSPEPSAQNLPVQDSAREFWLELASRPCETHPHARQVEDWLYEACRLAGLIQCEAIASGVTFAEAAVLSSSRLNMPMLLDMSCTAIFQSQVPALTGDLAGAFAWAAFVAAAAANGSEEARNRLSYDVRRWLLFAATSCLNLLATPNCGVFSTSVRTMLRVQHALRRRQRRQD